MSTPYLIAIAAMSRNRVIGKGGHIPWTCKEDMEWFKRTTFGRPVIVGRTTWDNLPKLKNILPVVLTSRPCKAKCNPTTAGVMREARRIGKTAYIIGGAQTYTALMPWTREILLTVIDIEVEGDTHFPEISPEFELKSTTPLSERAVVHHYVRR